MSFSCPHFDINRDACVRVKAECIPGRKGCVLQHNSKFAVPPDQRVAEAELAKPKVAKNAVPKESKR